jgi:hypothetical protein
MQRISKIVNDKLNFSGIKSWVDLGTGNGNVVIDLKWNKSAAEKYAIDKYPQSFGHNWKFVDELSDVIDVKKDLFTSFDCIEHMTKEDGNKLIDDVDAAFKYKVFFTPKGFLKQDEETHPLLMKENPWQKHLSGWTVKDFEDKGYKVIVLENFHQRPKGHNRNFDAILAYKVD